MRFEPLEKRHLLTTLWQNQAEPLDVNGDESITPFDVLMVLNELSEHGVHELSTKGPSTNAKYIDTNGDSMVTPFDALQSINALSSPSAPRLTAQLASHVDAASNPIITGRVTTGLNAWEETTNVNLSYQIDGGTAHSIQLDALGNFAFALNPPSDGSLDGQRNVTITAAANGEQVDTESISVTVDTTAPSINIDSLHDGGLFDGQQRLVGQIVDSNQIESVTYSHNGYPFKPLSIDSQGRFDQELYYVESGHHDVTIEAVDSAGNRATQTINYYVGDSAIWDGEAGDGLWSNPVNWAENRVPAAANTVIIGQGTNSDVTVNQDVELNSLIVLPTYTGTLDLGRNTLTFSGGITRGGGNLDAGTSTIIFNGNQDQVADFGRNASLGNIAVFKTGGTMTFASNGFDAFTLGVNSGSHVQFESGQTFGVKNLLINGTVDRLITLEGTQEDKPWQLDVASDGRQEIAFADIHNSDASGGAAIQASDNVADFGGNLNWSFGDAVRLSLSSDSNQSVIQEFHDYRLDIRANGVQPVTVALSQFNVLDGSSIATFFGLGGPVEAEVTTSGGAENIVSIIVTGNRPGSFKDDLLFQAMVGDDIVSRKVATVIGTGGPPAFEVRHGDIPKVVNLTLTPPIEGIVLETHTKIGSRVGGGEGISNSKILKPPNFPPTNSLGRTSAIRRPPSVEHFAWHFHVAEGAVSVNEFAGPGEPEEDDGVSEDDDCCNSNSIDTGNGEKRLSITDVTIEGRGLNFQFGRFYRSGDHDNDNFSSNDFGENWAYSYADERLIKDGNDSDGESNFVHFHPQQRGYVYINTDPNQWIAPTEHYSQLTRNEITGEFVIRERNGLTRTFFPPSNPNLAGRLKELKDRNGNRLTFHYEQFDPDIAAEGDEKFVLAYVIDTLGREIRYRYYARSPQIVSGRPVAVAHPTGNATAWGRLERIRDFKGDMDFSSANASEDFSGQSNNRTWTFDYDEEGNLVRFTSPVVTGSPNDNDFVVGKTNRYRYITESNRGGMSREQWESLTIQQRERLRHKLTHVWYPNEVGGTPNTNPSLGQAAEIVEYDINPASEFFGFAIGWAKGGTNGNEVPAGGEFGYRYSLGGTTDLNVQMSDRNSNSKTQVYGFNETLDESTEETRGFRPEEPSGFTKDNEYDSDRRRTGLVEPQGNSTEFTYNTRTSDRFQQGNLIRTVRQPNERGGDQTKIEEVFVYEPIYNQRYIEIDPRGADVDNNDFVPHLDDPVDRTIPDPYDPSKRVDLRYATFTFFDYQESTELAADAPTGRRDIDGSNGAVNQSPLIAVDGNVLATEILLIQELGLPESNEGLTELRKRLADNLVQLGLGDLNADGDTTARVSGDPIRMIYGSPVLFASSNQALVEAGIEQAGDLVNSTQSMFRGGSSEGIASGQLQTIVSMSRYNLFGQLTSEVSPEGNVTVYEYHPEFDPDGDGVPTPTPADGRSLTSNTGGYLKARIEDTDRVYFDETDNVVADDFSNSRQSPQATDIAITYLYDDVGNVISLTDGRGIETEFFVNEYDEVVQTTRASEIADAILASPSDPLIGDPKGPLTAFSYVERTFYDYNGNRVLEQVEDRGNTSNVDGSGIGDLPTHAINTTPGLSNTSTQAFDQAGGTAFVDTLYLYDILDKEIEKREEVSSDHALVTRYRYDANENHVLTILPEGNATTSVYDERDLLLRTTRGALTPPDMESPPATPIPTLLSPNDPTDYDVRGGLPCQCTTYHYDLNGNLIESVDSDDSDGSTANNSRIGGTGDRTRFLYDGYDRLTSVIDAVGNQTVHQYDPAGNRVRTLRFGPVGGSSPTANGPDQLPGPVSTLGVVQSRNLVNDNLLEATEQVYDSLDRLIQTDRVLFVNTIETMRDPDVADGAADIGKTDLTPADDQAIPGVSGITVGGRVTARFEYDRASRSTLMIQDDGDTLESRYDGANRIIETIDPVGNRVATAYDDNFNVIETRETDVAQTAGVASEVFVTTFAYDSLDRLQRSVDNIGQANFYRYDSRGNLVAMADAQGPLNGTTVERRAFADGDLTVNEINDFGNVTRYFFDGINRKVRDEVVLTDLLLSTGATNSGDGTSVGATLEGIKDSASDPESFVPNPDLNQGGGDGLIRTGFTYDDNSLESAVIDDNGNITMYLYDNLNRRVTATNGLVVTSIFTKNNFLGAREVVTPTFATIDDPGNVPTSQIDAQLASAKSKIDTMASLFPSLASRVDRPTTTVYGYSSDSNLLILEDENDTEIFARYDAINRKIAERAFRSGQSDAHVGDPVFAPAPQSDPSNPTSDFPAIIGTNVVDYEYDGLSRMVRGTDNNEPAGTDDDSIITYAYDSLGRVIEETQKTGDTNPAVVSSGWRSDNLRSTLIYPNDRELNYTFDKLDRLRTITDAAETVPIVDYDYIGTSRVLVRAFPQNGTRMTYLDDHGMVDSGYDGLRRPIELRHLREDDSIVVGFTYTYDRQNSKLTEGKLHDPTNDETYGYDSASRLINFDRPSANSIEPEHSDWNLDGVGNWNQIDGVERQHNALNELATENSTDFGYDENGNQTVDGTRDLLFQWDQKNRLKRVVRRGDNMEIAIYSYDASDRRIRKEVLNGGLEINPLTDGTTDYHYGDWQVLSELNESRLAQQYVYGGFIDEVLVLDRDFDSNGVISGPSVRSHYHQNTGHSVYAITDLDGVLQEAYQYDAYGRHTVVQPGPGGSGTIFVGEDTAESGGTSLFGNHYLFTGRRFDAETSLYHFRSRQLNYDQGRFLSRDPLGHVDGPNLYAAHFVPNQVDPSGAYRDWTTIQFNWKPCKSDGTYRLRAQYVRVCGNHASDGPRFTQVTFTAFCDANGCFRGGIAHCYLRCRGTRESQTCIGGVREEYSYNGYCKVLWVTVSPHKGSLCSGSRKDPPDRGPQPPKRPDPPKRPRGPTVPPKTPGCSRSRPCM